MAPRMKIESPSTPEASAAPKPAAPKPTIESPQASAPAEPQQPQQPKSSEPTAPASPKATAKPKLVVTSTFELEPQSASGAKDRTQDPAQAAPKAAPVARTIVDEPYDEGPSQQTPPPAPEPEPATDTDGSSAADRVRGARHSVTGWVHRTFPGHEHAFWGAVVAVVVALLVFAIGLPRMLLISLLVFVGIAIGQIFDGDPKIIRAIQELISSNDQQR